MSLLVHADCELLNLGYHTLSLAASTMPSDSEVIITDEFGDIGSANQHTVRHKVVIPVAAAGRLLKKKSACQKFPRTILPVATLAMILLLAILTCIIYETWWASKDAELGFRSHSKGIKY
jgi:hypothetical protein